MISKRLTSISKLINETIVYDIGSDHGYLIKFLFDNKVINKGYIIEINEKPLLNAKRTLSNYNNVTYFLSDGLDKVISIEKGSAVVIAGMGGQLISEIIQNDLAKLTNSVIYLQPNNREDILRKKLNELGFKIIEEHVIKDKGKYYFILKVTNGTQTLTNEQLTLGYNPEINTEYNEKIHELYLHYKSIVDSLDKTKNENLEARTKYKILKNYIGGIDEN